MNNNIRILEELVEKAKKAGSFFVSLSIRDKGKTEGDLQHWAVREDFDVADVITSLDSSVRSMGIKAPRRPDVFVPERKETNNKKLKIAIITHFNRCPDSYSPGKAVRNLIKILLEHGHSPVFFTAEGSKLTTEEIGCEIRPVVTRFKRQKNIVDNEAKLKFVDVLREQITGDFDLAISFDLFIDDCITYREAIKECGVNIEWLHYARSGIGGSLDFNMPNARYVYLNKADTEVFAHRIGVSHDKVRSIYNEKEPAYFLKWDPITKMIVDRFMLWDRDIIQTYPMCTTRMDAKGLNDVIKTFAKLKELGNKVALIVPNSNGRRRVEEIKAKKKFAEEMGLGENELIFTSLLADDIYKIESEIPNIVVAQLFQLSNLFIFPTRAENGPNVLLEASMTKNLLVLNEDLPLLFDFANEEDVIKYPFTSGRSLHYSGRDDESYLKLAKQINGQIQSNKADKQFRTVWRTHNSYSIYHDMLSPVLFETIKE